MFFQEQERSKEILPQNYTEKKQVKRRRHFLKYLTIIGLSISQKEL